MSTKIYGTSDEDGSTREIVHMQIEQPWDKETVERVLRGENVWPYPAAASGVRPND